MELEGLQYFLGVAGISAGPHMWTQPGENCLAVPYLMALVNAVPAVAAAVDALVSMPVDEAELLAQASEVNHILTNAPRRCPDSFAPLQLRLSLLRSLHLLWAVTVEPCAKPAVVLHGLTHLRVYIPTSFSDPAVLISQLTESVASSWEYAVFAAEPDLDIHDGTVLLRTLHWVFVPQMPAGLRRLLVQLRCTDEDALLSWELQCEALVDVLRASFPLAWCFCISSRK